MQKDLIFLTENGLTSTSANHIANLAKEYTRSINEDINNIDFITINASLMGTTGSSEIQQGVEESFLDTISEKLNKIAQANSLIAWLREAINAKANLLKELSNMTLEEYAKLKEITLPESPERKPVLTEDEYLATLTIKERNRYYSLQAKCAVLGQYIHPKGTFAVKREEYFKALKHKFKITGTGRDAIVYSNIPTVSKDKLEETYFALQKEHRDTQAEFNGIKYQMDKAIADDTVAKTSEYNLAFAEYTDKRNAVYAEMREYISKEAQRVSNLKIVIPDHLKGIYSEVSSLGK